MKRDAENQLPAGIVLRDPQPGDLGWVVQQHAALYAQEYGFNGEFEGLVAGIVAAYVKNFRPGLERCWIAELNGQCVGSVFVVRKSPRVAKLRLLILAKEARGYGLGERLVVQAIEFSRRAGYRKLVLWTQDSLLQARRIYAKHGFVVTDSEANHAFGQDLVSETWELAL